MGMNAVHILIFKYAMCWAKNLESAYILQVDGVDGRGVGGSLLHLHHGQ